MKSRAIPGWGARIARKVGALALTVLLGGLLGATLVRLAPGSDVDEGELDMRRSEAGLERLRESRAAERDLPRFYARYLGGLLRGDLGESRTLQRPVAELLRDRLPVTFRAMGLGLAGAWLLALALALPCTIDRHWAYDLLTTLVSGALLCLPVAVLALLLFYVSGPVPLAIALVVFPRVFRYARNLMLQTATQPHVLLARAKGLRRGRILVWHVLPVAAPQILALAGVSVSVAFGASIPLEVVCDTPGIGHLAWQAALGRDLPVLVNLTLLVTLVTLCANALSDVVAEACGAKR